MISTPHTTEPEWLARRRANAAAVAAALELPTTRTPGWEFTALGGFDPDAYPGADGGEQAAVGQAEAIFTPFEGGTTIDQIDALWTPAADRAVEGGPLVLPLSEAAERFPDLVRPHLGAVVAADDPFVARNDAGWTGGLFVYVPRGQRLEAPVLATAVQDAGGRALNWRTLIVLEEGAEAEVWEQYVSTSADADGLFNAVVELSVGDNARLRYICGQGLSERSWVFGSQRAEVARDGALDWVALGFGSARGKVRMETKLAGRGSEARVTGAYAGRGRQHLDYDTTQEHAAPNTVSDLAFRGILDGRSTSVWRGMIKVDPGAQQTDAFQDNRNLLLSRRAHADAIPGLEILANDVRCTHAAAVAQIDREQLFYLRARGLAEEVAKRLVIEGFMAELVERFEAGRLHDAVASALERRLAHVLDP